MKKEITILWGSDKDKDNQMTYKFENEHELNLFLQGVGEANGWLDYEIVEKK